MAAREPQRDKLPFLKLYSYEGGGQTRIVARRMGEWESPVCMDWYAGPDFYLDGDRAAKHPGVRQATNALLNTVATFMEELDHASDGTQSDFHDGALENLLLEEWTSMDRTTMTNMRLQGASVALSRRAPVEEGDEKQRAYYDDLAKQLVIAALRALLSD